MPAKKLTRGVGIEAAAARSWVLAKPHEVAGNDVCESLPRGRVCRDAGWWGFSQVCRNWWDRWAVFLHVLVLEIKIKKKFKKSCGVCC